MTDGNETEKAKPTLIKQLKVKSPEESDSSVTDRKKVVVVKKKVVVKKPQARVVAHHDDSIKDKEPAHKEHPVTEADASPERERHESATGAASSPRHAETAKVPAGNDAVERSVDDNAQSPVSVATNPVKAHPEGTRPSAPSGYQGSRPQGSGYQGTRPQGSGYQGTRPQGSGYQGSRPQGSGYQGSGTGGSSSGYQGSRPSGGGYQGSGTGGSGGGYQGSRPAGSGYQGTRPAGSGGYQGTRPAGSGGYQGTRPGGSPGYQGNRPGYGGSGAGSGRPGYGGARPGGGGGYGSRPGAPGATPAPDLRAGPSKRFIKAKKGTSYVRKEEELTQKLLMAKKKAEALKANPIPKSIDIMETISVAELARKMNLKPNELIGKLMKLGVMATINAQIDADTATLLASEYGCEVHIVSLFDETVIEKQLDLAEDMVHRPPVVTVMGHVDHGKTKLLDAIRKTDVVAGEFGGITQHIGAYMVETPKGRITFLDTPGHEAFTKMRARGSQVTDIVILVVAANDGVMPQTLEALDHAKAAGVPVIVAINKIDLPEANPDRVKTQLSEKGLIPEDWGGTTIFAEISALQKKGIPELLDSILLQAEVLELTANHTCRAEGKVLEAKIDHGRGIVATVIIKRGTLRVGDCFVAGVFPGKVRALFDEHGIKVDQATPSMPIEVIGFEGMPNAGDPFESVEDEKIARIFAGKRQELKKFETAKTIKKVTLDNLYDTIHDGAIQELKVLIKGDVTGSVEALKSSLEKLTTKEIRLNVLRSAAGAINEDDVMLASASEAIIIGFNVRPTPKAKILADQEKVEIRKYNIIYRVVEEIEKAMEGMLAPEIKDSELGSVEVRETYKVPKIGLVAGCYVLEGKVKRNCYVKVIREGIELYQGKITSLKRFKDDAKEVEKGFECGIGIEGCPDLKVGDTLEVYEKISVSRKLTK